MKLLSFEDKRPVLELTLRAFRVSRRNRSGVEIPVVEVTNRSGPDGQGKALDGDIRSFLCHRAVENRPLAGTSKPATRGG